MVFQEGALFPHMTVADNIAFGLPKKGAYENALQWLSRVGLPDFADRYPESLSGGQRQRVALARALAPEPRVLLFDEPYANLDVPFRRALREDARQIIRQTDSIGLLVTHDPDEVLTVADHVVVLDSGGIVDVGPPQGLFDAPRSTYGAELFGEPQVFDATMHDQVITTAVGDWDRSALIDPTISSDALKLVVDADHLLIDPDPQGLLIDEIRAVGRLDRLYLKSREGDAITFLDCLRVEGRALSAGMRVRVTPKSGKVFASPAFLA
jgi:iron(III) transport system ATP-binding protein